MTAMLKILAAVLDAGRDNNILFTNLQRLLDYLSFEHRTRGSHFIYWHDDIEEIINIQPDGSKAKSYQVKQVRNIIRKYRLH